MDAFGTKRSASQNDEDQDESKRLRSDHWEFSAEAAGLTEDQPADDDAYAKSPLYSPASPSIRARSKSMSPTSARMSGSSWYADEETPQPSAENARAPERVFEEIIATYPKTEQNQLRKDIQNVKAMMYWSDHTRFKDDAKTLRVYQALEEFAIGSESQAYVRAKRNVQVARAALGLPALSPSDLRPIARRHAVDMRNNDIKRLRGSTDPMDALRLVVELAAKRRSIALYEANTTHAQAKALDERLTRDSAQLSDADKQTRYEEVFKHFIKADEKQRVANEMTTEWEADKTKLMAAIDSQKTRVRR